MSHPQILEFRRRIDDVIYRFELCAAVNEYPAWKRTDADLWVVRADIKGWVVADGKHFVFSRPWNIEPVDQGPRPPECEWVGKKGDRAYVYDLVFP